MIVLCCGVVLCIVGSKSVSLAPLVDASSTTRFQLGQTKMLPCFAKCALEANGPSGEPPLIVSMCCQVQKRMLWGEGMVSLYWSSPEVVMGSFQHCGGKGRPAGKAPYKLQLRDDLSFATCPLSEH